MVLFVVTGMGIGVWWYYISPRKDYLSVHENGFKWRVKLCRWNHFPNSGMVLYEELKHIQFRADFAEPDFVRKAHTSRKDEVQDFIVDLFFPKGELRLTFIDGGQRVLENIMKRFSSKDIERFIDHIRNNHSELVQ
jgi:hypothetical protein